MLSVDHFGLAPTPDSALVLVHGFTQNARCWGRFGEELGRSWSVRAVDAPGHGLSEHDDADLAVAGDLVGATGERAHYLGYSMGGRMLLHTALGAHGAQMESLVLIGATAGIDDEPARLQRRNADNTLADRIEQLGTEAFIDEWLGAPLFAELTAEQACRSERLTNRADGLAQSLRRCGTGSQLPLWDRLHELTMPVLVIAGSHDAKFTELGHRLVECIGSHAGFVSVDGGHTVHLENPEQTAKVVREWRSRQV